MSYPPTGVYIARIRLIDRHPLPPATVPVHQRRFPAANVGVKFIFTSDPITSRSPSSSTSSAPLEYFRCLSQVHTLEFKHKTNRVRVHTCMDIILCIVHSLRAAAGARYDDIVAIENNNNILN